MLQARLDGLKPAEKLALQQASVIGVEFRDDALLAIDARAVDALPALVRRELIVPRQEASFDGVREYAFKHQILHHVTYDTLLKHTRRACHAKVATWMTGLSDARAGDFSGTTAEHFEKAGDNANACEFFARAAERAATRYAHEAAMGYLARAFPLAGGEGHSEDFLLRWRLLDVRERTLDLLGRRTEQRADIDALQRLADAMNDDRRRAEVAWRGSDFALRTGDFRAMESAAREAVTLARRAGDARLELRAQHRLASALGKLGNLEGCSALARSGLESARRQGLRHLEAIFLNALSLASEKDLIATLALDRQQLAIERELGNGRNEATTLSNLGWAWLALGEHVQARRHLEDALSLCRAVGDRYAESYPLLSLSQLELREGDAAQALVHAQSALNITTAVQDRGQETLALLVIGQANLALGRHAQAATAFKEAAALATDSDKRFDAAVGLAQVALAQRDVARAMRAIADPLAHLAGGDMLGGAEQPRLVQLVVYRVLALAGDGRASAVLASAHAALKAAAATITDLALRQSYLCNIPENRELEEAWAAQQRTDAANRH